MLEPVASRCPGGFRAPARCRSETGGPYRRATKGKHADDERGLAVETFAVIRASLRGR